MIAFLLTFIDDQNDKKLFETIYKNNIDELKRYAYYYLKNNEDSEDAIQDVFLKVAKNFDSISSRLKNENEWRNYLYMSVKNKSFDIIRKKNHQKDIIESLKVDFSNKNDEDFIALLESNNNIETIIQAIQSLGITYKLVLYQNLVMGLKPSEIAKIEGLKLSNVNQKLLRGKAMLRKNLERGVKNDKNWIYKRF